MKLILYSSHFMCNNSYVKMLLYESLLEMDVLIPLRSWTEHKLLSMLFENSLHHERKGLKYVQWKCKWSKWSVDALDAYNFCCPIYFCLRKYTYEVQGYDIGLFINLEPKNVTKWVCFIIKPLVCHFFLLQYEGWKTILF